jgi:hypothetical protein
MNEISQSLGTWKQLAQQSHKYPRLEQLALQLEQVENTPLPIPDFHTKTPDRQCPIDHRPITILSKNLTRNTASKHHEFFNVLFNKTNSILSHTYILLPCEAGLSDLAFQAGWRIIHPNLYKHEARKYDYLELTDSQFYDQYLQEDGLVEDALQYSADQKYYADNPPDADEEDFDEFTVIEPILEEQE